MVRTMYDCLVAVYFGCVYLPCWSKVAISTVTGCKFVGYWEAQKTSARSCSKWSPDPLWHITNALWQVCRQHLQLVKSSLQYMVVLSTVLRIALHKPAPLVS